MDGNGRWAAKRGLPRAAGHRAGAEAVRTTLKAAARAGVEVLTLYAFSSENWRRSEEEVSDLKGLLAYYVDKELGHAPSRGRPAAADRGPQRLWSAARAAAGARC
jgi:undecaprenyl diphosphate synthase